MRILKATNKDLFAVEKIFREFQKELNTPVCCQNFEQELANLANIYAAPFGAIFLALDADYVIGCVAYRPLKPTNTTAELKHLYVKDDFKGQGIGQKLLQHAIKNSQQHGYKTIVLETMDNMKQATALYLKNGFKITDSYSSNSDDGIKYYRYDFS